VSFTTACDSTVRLLSISAMNSCLLYVCWLHFCAMRCLICKRKKKCDRSPIQNLEMDSRNQLKNATFEPPNVDVSCFTFVPLLREEKRK
jgi:hypothetical protein